MQPQPKIQVIPKPAVAALASALIIGAGLVAAGQLGIAIPFLPAEMTSLVAKVPTAVVRDYIDALKDSRFNDAVAMYPATYKAEFLVKQHIEWVAKFEAANVGAVKKAKIVEESRVGDFSDVTAELPPNFTFSISLLRSPSGAWKIDPGRSGDRQLAAFQQARARAVAEKRAEPQGAAKIEKAVSAESQDARRKKLFCKYGGC